MTENGKNFVQVEKTRVPRDVADMLSKCQVWSVLSEFGQYQYLLIWIESHMKTFDTALSVDVWEIDE